MSKLLHSFDNVNGEVIADTERYHLVDNRELNNLVLSKTILHMNQSTRGHSHAGQEEVYFFVEGSGEMIVDEDRFDVSSGTIVQIPDGAFHRVLNGDRGDLEFICVFDGKRNH